ncbi:MAG: DUF1156 domain-containing protein [Gammaproteobacteria bacterium]|nr:DUF1156 domain-containing protein [Gammaproteobacteria bacterium]MDE0413755.1 DUF1156 domain-containing protein [Gammaproteobacteria bacterium]
MTEHDRRLIEDYLPLDVLNAIASLEKKHPKRYVELVHYWPARRPITACRAAIYASLTPAPRTGAEREEAASFVSKLAAYKLDPATVAKARQAIKELHGGRTPKVLDLFAGGGAIPLEAARLGCESHAVDYNPVAHMIELCTLVYPQTFGPSLANDFQRWSTLILDRMREEIGNLYPAIDVPHSKEVSLQTALFGGGAQTSEDRADPVAYIWTRTVPCRRPGCAAPVPLVRQSWLRKKGGAIAAVPRIEDGKYLCWDIVSGGSASEVAQQTRQTGSGQAVCVACNTPAPADYVKEMAVSGRMKDSLAAIVAALPPKTPAGKKRTKVYLPPDAALGPDSDAIERRLAALEKELGFTRPEAELQGKLRDQLPAYGVEKHSELFTSRQLLVLFTLIGQIRRAHDEMIAHGMPEDRARALKTFFAMAFGRFVISFNKFSRWYPNLQRTVGAIGDRQALKMIYDFSDINPLARTQGCLSYALDREAFCIRELAKIKQPCVVTRGNAEKLYFDDETFDAVVTDPPYYSSIFYADLSAFFYVWLKRIVGDLYPEHFALDTPPKRREAVAQPSEHGGDANKAKAHYERLMRNSLAEARRVLKPGAPLVCVYAHRTTEGWATLIRALVGAGMTVTEAWPVQTEARGRTNAMDAAALSDSIFFVARRREQTGAGQYETEVAPQLQRIARERVKTLWNGGKGIGGADLLMAAVGAGLRAYTQFSRVEYANGDPVSAERYLREVEGVVLDVMLDEIFGLRGSAVASVDSISRFYILWRFTYRESSIEAGDAYVFCYPQGIEIDGPDGLTGNAPKLVEKSGGKFRVRNFAERGDHEELGLAENGKAAPLVDVLHRLLYLLEEQPGALPAYLKSARPNTEQLRLVTQALCAPVLGGSQAPERTATPELGAMQRLNANWRSVVEGAAYAQEIEALVGGTGDLFGGEELQ